MRYIILLFILSFSLSASAQQYVITNDAATCRISVKTPAGVLKEMFVNNITVYTEYPDRIQISDGVTTFRSWIGQINNYATVAALEADLDTWIAACAEGRVSGDTLFIAGDTS